MPDDNIVGVAALNRRKFLGVLGVSAAVAGSSLGCVRKPQEKIVPHSRRPEDLIPGKPRYYATCAHVGGGVLGLLVESQDGRPTKVEGNPKHPMSQGAANVWAQAEVLNLYDPDRSRSPARHGKAASWQELRTFLQDHSQVLQANQGRGLSIVLQATPSPTLHRMLAELKAAMPQAGLYRHDAAHGANAAQGLAMLGVPKARVSYSLEKADVILALDADPLGFEGDAVRNARAFAAGRRMESPQATMNRLYAVEAFFSATGAIADHRLRVRSAEVPTFLEALAAELVALGMNVPDAAALLGRLSRDKGKPYGRWPAAVAADLWKHRGRAVLVTGERQPPAVHALAALVNEGLSAFQGPASLLPDEAGFEAAGLVELARDMEAGKVQTLVVLGGNPLYDAPADLGLPALFARVPVTLHHGLHIDETAAVATWHVPASHFLEAWGDLRASDGTASIQQPLIAPLFETVSAIELLGLLTGSQGPQGYELVRATWSAKGGDAGFDRQWRRWLHDGIIAAPPPAPVQAKLQAQGLMDAWRSEPPAPGGPDNLEVDFRLDPSVFDGRYANNGWLQEVPDPVSKLAWDNAAWLSPGTAEALGVRSGDMVELMLAGRSARLPVFVVPGNAEHAVVVSLGYGRRQGGSLAAGTGFDVNPLRTSAAPWFALGGKLSRTGASMKLATTQEHGSMEGRPIVLEGSLEQYREDPKFVHHAMHHDEHPSLLFTPSNELKGQQWGMSIDLSACTGCNACVVACQAENNIPVVGKQRVLEQREMHWLRLDRYFTGTVDDPRMVTQPMACVHCETAPCESVCPVTATAHSPEGLNDQAYQRCIGTRYCSNNCPYKVRRFNFFQYNKGIDPLVRMQKNPDVTLRFRGVMEKCTYCVQRINEAKIAARREGQDVVADGAIQTACQQTCPSQAIVFGNINDPDSAVARRKRQERDYGVLADLNTRPRTSYLARLRNPNPELV
jgi:molybdopterin-containing oxidoreductase family iron-sulfur binding subunit